MELTDEDLKKIEQSAEEMKNYKFLIQIKTLQEIREVKKLLEQQYCRNNSGTNAPNGT